MPKDRADGEYSRPVYKSEDEIPEDDELEDSEGSME